MPVRHDRIRANGWRQGSVFTMEDGQALLGERADADRLILVSHDCDIVNPGEREPLIEVCVARPVARLDGNYVRGKNVRTLHVEMQIDGRPAPYALEASERRRFDRSQLEEMVPAGNAMIPADDLRIVTRWLARRYLRAALPDSFNERLRPAQDAIRDALRDDGVDLSSVLIALNTEDELPVDQSYSVYVVGLSPKDIYDDAGRRESASRAVAGMAAAMNGCRGIDVVEFLHLSEDDFTLHDLRSVIEYSCEDLSLGENDGAPLLPRG